MNIEYQHEGITYHEPLPRLLLVNFASTVVDALKSNGHNAQTCTIRRPVNTLSKELWSPKPPNEVDVLLVRDQGEWVAHLASKAIPNLPQQLVTFSSAIMRPSGYKDGFYNFCHEIFKRGGMCVFFVSEPQGTLLEQAGFGAVPNNASKAWPQRTALRQHKHAKYEALNSFVDRWLKIPSVYIGIACSVNHIDLVEDTAGIPYAVLIRDDTSSGLIICLPDYGDRADILNSFLSDLLPELAPRLFPFRYDLSWLKEPEFVHPKTFYLYEKKQTFRDEVQVKLDKIDEQIQALDQSEQYLKDLLTSDGDKLKDAVKRALEELLAVAGVKDVSVLDVDSNPALRGGSPAKREDLRIHWGENVFLINVAGRERYLKQTSLNQLSEHQRLFLKSNTMNSENLHSLLIANFNYQGGVDPRKRGEMFGSGTSEARDRLNADGRGAIGTFDLYRLIRATQRKEVQAQPSDFLGLLVNVGILDFEEFRKSLKAPDSPSR